MAPALAGPTFRQSWEKQPLLAPATRIKKTMPPTGPNSLWSAQVTDLVSFVLLERDLSRGRRDTVLGEQLLRLILMDIHFNSSWEKL